jgi:quinol monooxygenase YgiN
MSDKDHISFLLEMELKPGGLDDWRALMEEMVAATSQEKGALDYEWSVSDDGTVVHLWERYADNDATMEHTRNFEQFAERFFGLAKPTQTRVYGNPSDEVKETLAGLRPVYMKPLGGFSR